MNLLNDNIEEIFIMYNMIDIDNIHRLPSNLKRFATNSGYFVRKYLDELKSRFPYAEFIVDHENNYLNMY